MVKRNTHKKKRREKINSKKRIRKASKRKVERKAKVRDRREKLIANRTKAYEEYVEAMKQQASEELNKRMVDMPV